jgi:HAD superfamily hydrolase (TIGR01509 family)
MDENATRPAAILWDMDGTLIDSEPYWMKAEITLCAEYDVSWSRDDAMAITGLPLERSGEALRDRGVNRPVSEIVGLLLDEVSARVRESIPWQEDARRLLDRAISAGIPCALVTMSYRRLAEAVTDREPAFGAVVAGDMVSNGKPHPEPYLKAAELLGVPIASCLAIEDSGPGVASAHAAGARTVGIQRLIPIQSLPGISRVASLDSLTDEAIAAIMAGAVVDELVDEADRQA